MDFVLCVRVYKGKDSKRLLSAGASIKLIAYCVFVDNRSLCVQKSFFAFLHFLLKCSVSVHALTGVAGRHPEVGKCYTWARLVCVCSSRRQNSFGLLAEATVFEAF